MSKRNVFSEVGGLHPRRSVFDLSYEKKLTCDMAQLIPPLSMWAPTPGSDRKIVRPHHRR